MVTFSFEYMGEKSWKKTLNLVKKSHQEKTFWKENKPRFSDTHKLIYVLKY